MKAVEFASWRQQVGLTQEKIAEKLGVTRTTIQNWESGSTPIPVAVETSCDLWGHRLKQEDPNVGPVTLVYSDGPMFINPYGPRRRLAMMHQEPYPTNAAALARVQVLWGREDFHNPLIIEESGKPLWNVVELERVVRGDDAGAPTISNMLKALAEQITVTSTMSVRSGPKMLSPAEARDRQERIEDLAGELEKLAAATPQGDVTYPQVEEVFSRLRRLGKHPMDSLVSSIAQAFVSKS